MDLKEPLTRKLQTPEGKADVARLSDAISFGVPEAVLIALNEVAGELPDDEAAALRRALARLTPPKQ